MEKARETLQEDDLVQASEKLWDAAAQMVKGVAERRGWPHSSHRELFRVVRLIARETGDIQVLDLFQIANSLHTNFYENWMTREFVENSIGRMQEFISRLEM
jgi:hypothetical protein